jgi:hypothetical protein
LTRRFTAALLCFFALTASASAQSVDSERLALAQRVVNLIWTPANRDRDVSAIVSGMEGMLRMTAAFSGGAPRFDGEQLERSFRVGATEALANERAQIAEALSNGMSRDQLQTALDFYSSSSGRAAIRARVRHQARVAALIRRAADGEAVELPQYQPSAPERTFLESDAGIAFAAAFDSAPPSSDTRQTAFQRAEADYCERAFCDEGHHEFFQRMYISVNTSRARGEYAVWGETAADVFSDEPTAALARAACAGDTTTVARLATEGADPNAAGGEIYGDWGTQGMTPLMWAISCGNLQGIEALLAAGADPNQAEPNGGTPVNMAARNRNPEILRLLLREGGDPNAHRRGETALQTAAQAEPGFEFVDGMPPERAWANWDALIEAGADPNFIAPDGRPLVIEAAEYNQWNTVEWLLNRGWDGDWVLLGRILERSEEVGGVHENRRAALGRVRAMLVARGVRFPVGGLMQLERDERGHHVQRPAN